MGFSSFSSSSESAIGSKQKVNKKSKNVVDKIHSDELPIGVSSKRVKTEVLDCKTIISPNEKNSNERYTNRYEDIAGEDIDYSNPYECFFHSHVELRGMEYPISSLGFDNRGHRLICTGSHAKLGIWDFSTLSSTFQTESIHTIYEDKCQMKVLMLHPNEDKILVIGNSSQIKVINGAGKADFTSPLGDKYIQDLTKTTGHIGLCNGGFWHKSDANKAVSFALDGTLRIWDVSERMHAKAQKAVLRVRDKTGKRIPITACAMSSDAKFFVLGLSNGSIEVYRASFPYTKPVVTMSGAHTQPITSVSCSPNIHERFVTRCTQGVVKLWNLTPPKLNHISTTVERLYSNNEESRATYSDDGTFILTGTSAVGSTEALASVVFLSADDLSIEYRHYIPDTGPKHDLSSLSWCGATKQLACGMTDGIIRIYYHPTFSHGGVLMALNKGKSTRTNTVANVDLTKQKIIAPFALKIFKEDYDPHQLRKQNALKKQQQADTSRPADPGRDQLEGRRAQQSWKEHLLKEVKMDETRSENPRDAILKFSEIAALDPKHVGKAYQKTQPVPILSEKIYSAEEDDDSSDNNEEYNQADA